MNSTKAIAVKWRQWEIKIEGIYFPIGIGALRLRIVLNTFFSWIFFFSHFLFIYFLTFFFSHNILSAMPGSISLPSDEESGISRVKNNLNQARNWFSKIWNGDNDEAAPLLNSGRPKRNNFRLIVTSIALVVALIILGLTIGLWANKHDNKKSSKKFVTTIFMRVICY
jgi:hypothetical protein